MLCTGTDEHGSKIQQAAAQHGVSPTAYCEQISASYRALFGRAGIAYTDYIRTTEPRHARAVAAFWVSNTTTKTTSVFKREIEMYSLLCGAQKTLQANDTIYTTKYSGWYCVPDETFLTDTQLTKDATGVRLSAESGHPVEWTVEQNYMFRLSKYQADVVHWLSSG